MSFTQVSALASGTPIALQVIVYGHITLGILQEFARLEASASKDVSLAVGDEKGSETLFHIHGAEIVSARCLDLLGEIAGLENAGISHFFVDARYLDERSIKTVCASFGKSPPELASTCDAVSKTVLREGVETILTGGSSCNGWFHGNPGIGEFR